MINEPRTNKINMDVTKMIVWRTEFTKRSVNLPMNFGALTQQTRTRATSDYTTYVRPEE